MSSSDSSPPEKRNHRCHRSLNRSRSLSLRLRHRQGRRAAHCRALLMAMDTGSRAKKVQLILNGKAASNDALQTAVARQRAIGHAIEVRVTAEKGDAKRFVAEAGEVDLLIAAGGDGTLNEMLHGLMALSSVVRPVLGIVPLGTANDFATGCGIPHDTAAALALCVQGRATPVDVGKANERWFLNAASVGF